MDRRHALRSFLALGSLASIDAERPAFAADAYPSRPIKLIVPYAPEVSLTHKPES